MLRLLSTVNGVKTDDNKEKQILFADIDSHLLRFSCILTFHLLLVLFNVCANSLVCVQIHLLQNIIIIGLMWQYFFILDGFFLFLLQFASMIVFLAITSDLLLLLFLRRLLFGRGAAVEHVSRSAQYWSAIGAHCVHGTVIAKLALERHANLPDVAVAHLPFLVQVANARTIRRCRRLYLLIVRLCLLHLDGSGRYELGGRCLVDGWVVTLIHSVHGV